MSNNVFVANIPNTLEYFLEQKELTRYINKRKKDYTAFKDFVESILNQRVVDFTSTLPKIELQLESYVDYAVYILDLPEYTMYDDVIKLIYIIIELCDHIINSLGIDILYNIYSLNVIDIKKDYIVLLEVNKND